MTPCQTSTCETLLVRWWREDCRREFEPERGLGSCNCTAARCKSWESDERQQLRNVNTGQAVQIPPMRTVFVGMARSSAAPRIGSGAISFTVSSSSVVSLVLTLAGLCIASFVRHITLSQQTHHQLFVGVLRESRHQAQPISKNVD